MKKRLLFGLVLWAMCAVFSAFAQETLTVYDGSDTNNKIPIYGLYCDNYVKCEYVIPADDLASLTGCNITSLTWYLSQTASAQWANTNFQVFVKEVDSSTLSTFSGTEGATMVYEGTIDGTQSTITLEFTTPHMYQGGNLLIGVYNTAKGTYKSAYFYGTNVDNAAVMGYSSASLAAVTPAVNNFIPKTTFGYLPKGTVVYYKPKNLAVSNITTESADVTWDAGGTESTWNFAYKKQADTEWIEQAVSQNTVTLTDLDRSTNYDVRVQSDYGDGNLSDFIETSFTTIICDDDQQGQISYELTDTYGDGWGSNQIQVVHHNTGLVIESLTISSGKSASGTLSLCYGEEYDFVWVSGSYASECGFTIYDEGNAIILEHASGKAPTAGVLKTYLMSAVTCKRPSDLTAQSVAYNAATLTWTPGDEDQDSWEVVYGEGADFAPDAAGATPIAVSANPTVTIEGLSQTTTYRAFVRANCGGGDYSAWSDVCEFTTPEQFPTPTNVTVTDVTAHEATVNWQGDDNAESYTLRYRRPAGYETFFYESFENGLGDWTQIDNDGDGDGWALSKGTSWQMSDGSTLPVHDGEFFILSRSFASQPLSPDNWLISPQVDLKGTLRYFLMDDGEYDETYRIYVSTTGTNIEDFEPLTDDLQSPKSINWVERSHDLSAFAGQKGYIAFRNYNCTDRDFIFIDGIGIYGDPIKETDWVVIENVTSPCVINGLDPQTKYEVQVQANYADGNSQWTDPTLFATIDELTIPKNLTVSEEGAHTATATWEGIQDSYNLRYREMLGYFEFFEDGIPTDWTIIDADGDGNNWYKFSPTSTTDNSGNPVVFGTACATSASYLSGALTPDNWLITPLVDLKGNLSVWLRGQDPSYAAEHFAIYLSTTGTAVEDFTTVLVPETTATGVYKEYTADLSQYEGTQGYIAIRHFNCTDQFRLNVDNFAIHHGFGDWVEAQNVTSPYVMEGLNPMTQYEVQVQGIVGDQTTEWSATVPFMTTEATETTLADLVSQGVNGSGYVVTDNPVMVAMTDDTEYVYVTDGNEAWARIEGLNPALFNASSALVGIEGDLSSVETAPALTLSGIQPTTEAADAVTIETFDLTTPAPMPKRNQVVKIDGYYNGKQLTAGKEINVGINIDLSHSYATMTAGNNYSIVAAIELIEPWTENTPTPAPLRIAETDEYAIGNLSAVIISAEEIPATGVTDINADRKGEVRYYDLGGRYVGKSLDQVPAGVYVGSDGVKVIKK